jgi:hypothetical protein
MVESTYIAPSSACRYVWLQTAFAGRYVEKMMERMEKPGLSRTWLAQDPFRELVSVQALTRSANQLSEVYELRTGRTRLSSARSVCGITGPTPATFPFMSYPAQLDFVVVDAEIRWLSCMSSHGSLRRHRSLRNALIRCSQDYP